MVEKFGPEPTSVADLECMLDDHGLIYTVHVVCTNDGDLVAKHRPPGIFIACDACQAKDFDDDDVHSLAYDLEQQARAALPKTIQDPEFDLFNSRVVNWLMQHRRMAAIRAHQNDDHHA